MYMYIYTKYIYIYIYIYMFYLIDLHLPATRQHLTDFLFFFSKRQLYSQLYVVILNHCIYIQPQNVLYSKYSSELTIEFYF